MRSPHVLACMAAYRASWRRPTGQGPRGCRDRLPRREPHASDTLPLVSTLRNESKGNLKQTDKAFDRASNNKKKQKSGDS